MRFTTKLAVAAVIIGFQIWFAVAAIGYLSEAYRPVDLGEIIAANLAK